MKFAQIINGRVHWLFDADVKPEFEESMLILEVTGVFDIQEGYIYDLETNTFSPPVEQPIPPPTVEEKIDILESKLKSDNLTTFEVMATMYDESATNTLTQFEVMATMYSEIIALREEVAQLKGGV